MRWDIDICQRQEAYARRLGRHLTLEQLAALSGASRRVVERLVSLELIERVWVDGQPLFPVEQLSLVRRILRLRFDLGVSWSSMDLVLHLLERLERLERQMDGA